MSRQKQINKYLDAEINRCRAMTLKCERCKNKAVIEGFCLQHVFVKRRIIWHSKFSKSED